MFTARVKGDEIKESLNEQVGAERNLTFGSKMFKTPKKKAFFMQRKANRCSISFKKVAVAKSFFLNELLRECTFPWQSRIR